jgi:phospholipase/lecithinase/hemolysin
VPVPSSSYSGLVIFGDSLSDTGNVRSLTLASQTTANPQPTFPNFTAAPGRFSNGPVWTEYLAADLGFASSANPSNLLFNGSGVIPIGAQGGQNFAYGGARTGLGGSAGATTGLLGQLVAWDNSTSILGGGALMRAADPNALYVVMAGANDLRDIRTANPGASDAQVRASAAAGIAQNVTNALGLLANAGARHFLISSLPDLGLTPEAAGLGLIDASRDVTLSFNSALAAKASSFDAGFNLVHGVDLDIRTLDFYGLVNRIGEDATHNSGATYGITNITTPCITIGSSSHEYFFPDASATACNVAAFSDNLHPSGASHALLGALAAQTALAPVPEPTEVAMMIAGLLLLGSRLRRRASVAA